MARSRIDALLVERGLAESREKAQALILAGKVRVDDRLIQKSGQLVSTSSDIVVAQPQPYVSRGGYKLAYALDQFAVDVTDRVVVDVGASTGGFTDVLLQRGARRVYAVDVGHGQLHWRLRKDERVVVLERTNARYLEPLPEQPSLAVVDVSFISLRLIVPPVYRVLEQGSTMIVLVKPQFEAGRADVTRGGIVRSPEVHYRVLADLQTWLPQAGLNLGGVVASPIRGTEGNVEFLARLEPLPGQHSVQPDTMQQVVDRAHEANLDKGVTG